MAQITINIPDNILTRVIAGVAYDNGYRDQLLDENNQPYTNPETKSQFSRKVIIRFIKNSVKSFERNQAVESAKVTAETAAETEITIS